MAANQRRVADEIVGNIDELILSENDPSKRAILVVLQSLSRASVTHMDMLLRIEKDTRETNMETRNQIDNHEQFIATQKVQQKMSLGILAAAQCAVISVCGYAFQTVVDIKSETIRHGSMLATLEKRLEVVEGKDHPK